MRTIQAKTWQRVSTIVAQALELPASERMRFLDDACSDEPRIRREAEVLLAFDSQVLDAEDRPVFELFSSSAAKSADDPERVGPYEIVGELGRGGMSDVFLARRDDGMPPTEVAVKVLRRGLDGADGTLRLYQEGEILGRLRHPHIASVLGGGLTEDGRAFLLIEKVTGLPIDEHCQSRALGLEGRLEIFLDVCEAVAFAHRKLVVHRDLKPSNILVSEEGQAKLLDFGIAKWLDAAPGAPVTATGLRALTPEYASPEQVRGEPVSISSDTYALGVVLFHLLTGKRPFSPSSVESLLHQICHQDAPKASAMLDPEGWRNIGSPTGFNLESWRRRLRGDLDMIVAKALRKEPEHRYASVADLAQDVRHYLDLRPVAARSGNAFYRFKKALLRHRRVVMLLAAFAVVLVALLVDRFGVYQRLQHESRRAMATEEFLIELFANADPNDGHGGELTVREALERGVEEIDRLGDQPFLQGHLLNMIGHIYANLGRGQEAESLARKALDLHTETSGESSREAADSHRLLGRVLSENGAFDEADRHLQRAIELYDGPFPAPRAHAEILTTLAFNLQQQGDSEQALAVAQASLELCRREGLEESAEMAVAYNNLGFVHHGRGDIESAVEAFEKALVLNSRIHGEDHPMVALAHSNLGAIAVINGETEKAITRLDAAYAIWRRTVGEDDHMVLTNRHNLAALLFNLERHDEAIEALDRLLPRMESTLGAKHPLFSEGLTLQAKALDAAGHDPARVSELRRRALELCLELYGENHLKTAAALTEMAVDRRAAEPEEAIAWLRRALTVEQRLLEAEDPRLLETKALLVEFGEFSPENFEAAKGPATAGRSPVSASDGPPPNPGAP